MQKYLKKKISFSALIIIILGFFIVLYVSMRCKEVSEMGFETPWFIKDTLNSNKTVILKNAYIIGEEGEIVEYIYENHHYVGDASLSQAFVGIGDVVIKNGKIAKICAKKNKIEGILSKYSNQELVLDEDKALKMGKDIIIYKVSEYGVEEVKKEELVLGNSKLELTTDSGIVTAMVVYDTVPKDIRVLIKNGNSIFFQDIYLKKEFEGTNLSVNQILEKNNIKELTIRDNVGIYLCDSNYKVKGSLYEGEFHVMKVEEGLVLVNVLPVETYVKYVLPSEMPKRFSKEALKAQAVCARTFAYSQMKNGKYAEYGANLDNTTAYQVYHATGRYEETDQAVDETQGEVIVAGNELIFCYYFSTCAGVSNDLTVWGNAERPYIASKGKENIKNLNLAQENDFRSFINGSYKGYDSESPFYRWDASLDVSKIIDKEKGKLIKLEVKKRNASGYIIELQLHYEKAKETIRNENSIRKILGKYLKKTKLADGAIRENLSMVPSSCFYVSDQNGNNISLRGGGFGHGIGMSQYGADKMAKENFDYKEIIKYYYNDVDIKKLAN